MKIALFGGSFDPPHMGHDAVVKLALNTLDIDKLIIMPTFISPFKNKFAAPALMRLKWVIKIWSTLPKVQISDYEIRRQKPVPTIDTVRYLYQIYDIKSLYLIVGADHLASLNKWHEYDKLCELVTFVIASRDNIEIPRDLNTLDTHVDISSSQIRHHEGLDEIPESIKNEVIEFYKGEL